MCPGSNLSLSLLEALADKGLNDVFLSETIRVIILYKMQKVIWLGYTFLGGYILYLASLNFYPNMYLMTFWFIFYAFKSFVEITGNWDDLGEYFDMW